MADQLVPLLHEPIRPPRPTFDGECIFAEEWIGVMARSIPRFDRDPMPMIEHVLGDMRVTVTQRHATVLASVATWLGTNCGRAMLQAAEHGVYQPGTLAYSHRYLMAWAAENHRCPGVNGGIRIIEHVLMEQWPEVTFGVIRYQVPDISAEDLECADHLMAWLAEFEGQRFLNDARAKVAIADKARRRREMAEWSTATSQGLKS